MLSKLDIQKQPPGLSHFFNTEKPIFEIKSNFSRPSIRLLYEILMYIENLNKDFLFFVALGMWHV